jgi:hypothetical protein
MYNLFTKVVTRQEQNEKPAINDKNAFKVLIDYYRAQSGTDLATSMSAAVKNITSLRSQLPPTGAISTTLSTQINSGLNDFYNAEVAMSTIVALAIMSRPGQQGGRRKKRYITHKKYVSNKKKGLKA